MRRLLLCLAVAACVAGCSKNEQSKVTTTPAPSQATAAVDPFIGKWSGTKRADYKLNIERAGTQYTVTESYPYDGKTKKDVSPAQLSGSKLEAKTSSGILVAFVLTSSGNLKQGSKEWRRE